jgi:hypothetical protein
MVMRMFTWLVGGALAAAASAAGAQPIPQSHQLNEAIEQHQAVPSSEKCCCEEMMRKMMREMMQKHHQSMGTAAPKDAPQPDKEHAH